MLKLDRLMRWLARTVAIAIRWGGVLADMEPDLQLLSGMLVALRTLGAGQEPVEQSAIAALARLGEDTMERVQQGWRSAYRVSLRGRQQR